MTFISTVALVLFAALLATAQPHNQPFYSGFDGYSMPFLSDVTFQNMEKIPGLPLLLQNYTGLVGNNPATSQVVVSLGVYTTYIYPDATYNVFPLPGSNNTLCTIVTNYTYAFEVAAKKNALKFEYIYDMSGTDNAGTVNLPVQNQYFGNVNDAGAGLNVKVAYSSTTDAITGQVRRATFSSPIPTRRNLDGSCPPSPGTLYGAINFAPSANPIVWPPGFFTLPASCNTPIEYTNIFCVE